MSKAEATSASVAEKMDGGLCWLIVLGSFLSQFTAFGFHNAFGQLYIELLQEFGESKALTAWVGSSSYALSFMLGPLAGVACTKFGCSATAIVGGVLFGLGLFLSSFVDTISKMYVTYSVLVAVGSSCIYYSSILVLTDYFSKNLVLANGIALSGVGVGTIAIAPAFNFLLEHFGWRTTLKIMSASSLLLVFSGLLYRAVPAPSKPHAFDEKATDQKLLDVSVFKNKAYLIWTVVLALVLFGFYVPYVHLVRHCQDLEIPKHKGVVLVGYISISQTVGKVFFGRVADHPRVNRVYLFQFSLLACSVLTTLLPILTSHTSLLAYCWIYGICDGCFVVLIAILTGDIVGKKKFTSAFGILFFVTGISMMLGPLVAGWIYDLHQTYNPAFFMAGGFTVLGVSLVFLIPFLLPPEVEEEWRARSSKHRYILHSASSSNLSNDSQTKTSFLQSDSESEGDKDDLPPKTMVVEIADYALFKEKTRSRLDMSLGSVNYIHDRYLSIPKRMSQHDSLLTVNYYNSEPLGLSLTSFDRETVL